MALSDIGVIGLGTMGRNLLLNIADHGYGVSGFDKNVQQRDITLQAGHKQVHVHDTMESFISSLSLPRKIIILVPAGKIVDGVLKELKSFLSGGDIVIDGGNSHFTDTDRRYFEYQELGFHFMGMGVSGGEEGARNGPSMMPGSNKEAYGHVKDILESIAAKVSGKPCVQFIGDGAAGHYTKMVHNGIEYAMMQLISEVYSILQLAGLNNDDLHRFFYECNDSALQGYLIEITAAIFTKKDELSNAYLIDKILDTASQKGTGMWMSQSALDLGVTTSIIDTAVQMRNISSQKNQRIQLSNLYPMNNEPLKLDMYQLQQECKESLYLGFLMAYAQGMHLLKVASKQYNYNIQMNNVIEVWKGGCIIRSSMLDLFQNVYTTDETVVSPLGSPWISTEVNGRKSYLKNILQIGLQAEIPLPALSNAWQYVLSITKKQLPTNLIQAQRDFFGAHTYQRIDRDGSFHTEWK